MKTGKLSLLTRTRTVGLLIMIVSVGASFGTAHAQTCPGPAPQPHQLGDAFTFHAFLAWQGVPIGSPTPRRIALHFRLYDAQQGGSQVGPTLCFRGPDSPSDPAQCEPGAVLAGTRVLASEGHVAAALDFGPQFAGENLWLETEIFDDNFLLAWQILSPRMQIGLSPYAKYATEVADDTVTVVKLVDEAVCTDKIADDAVTDTKIALNAVTSWQIAPGAVGTAELASGSVTADEIADGQVDTAELADGSVTNPKIALGAVGAGQIDTTGAGDGQALVYNDGSQTLEWADAGLELPYYESFAGTGPAFWIEHTGAGAAGIFDSTGGGPALVATQTDQDPGNVAFMASNTGDGFGAVIFTRSMSGSYALWVDTSGTGGAALFSAGGPSPALEVQSGGTGDTVWARTLNASASCGRFEALHASGTGTALIARTSGLGRGAFVEATNTSNTLPALEVTSNGGGPAVLASNDGTGPAGQFQVLNTSSAADTLYAANVGTGRVAQFTSMNPNTVLPAVAVNAFGTGDVLLATTSNASALAGHFQVANTASTSPALFAETNSVNNTAAIFGEATALTGNTEGVRGESASVQGTGVYGQAWNTGVTGESLGFTGTGVRGWATGSNGRGVLGEAWGTDGIGVLATGPAGPTGFALFCNGRSSFTGTMTKPAGAFKIDHPLDPERKYLYHSFVESPDMMNIYNGNVVLDENGEDLIELPDWFEALNRDFRYQLTPIGAPGPDLYVAREIHDKRFKIAGGAPGLKVSWQVTGIRQDPFANAHRLPVEEDKPEREIGSYLQPEVYGMPRERGLDWALGIGRHTKIDDANGEASPE